jgi:POT family proton-dependent oligopeptide transporter
VGLSATTKLSPKRYVGQMMGIWFVGASLGNLIAGLFAGGVNTENASQMPALFLSVVTFAVISGALFIIFNPILKKWMGDVK